MNILNDGKRVRFPFRGRRFNFLSPDIFKTRRDYKSI